MGISLVGDRKCIHPWHTSPIPHIHTYSIHNTQRLLEQLHASSHQAMPSTLSPSSTSASLSPSTSNHGDGHAEDAGEDYVKNAHTGGDVKNAHTGGGEIMPLADHRRHNMSKCQTTPPQPCTPQPPCDDSTCCTDVRDTNPSKRSVHNTSPIDQASSSSASPTYPTWEQHISTHTAHVQQAVSTAWHSAQEMLSTQVRCMECCFVAHEHHCLVPLPSIITHDHCTQHHYTVLLHSIIHPYTAGCHCSSKSGHRCPVGCIAGNCCISRT